MTTPTATTTDGLLAQILVEQGKQGTQLAVISEQLKAVPDHETRIRRLEQFRLTAMGAALAVSALVSGIGTWIGSMVIHR